MLVYFVTILYFYNRKYRFMSSEDIKLIGKILIIIAIIFVLAKLVLAFMLLSAYSNLFERLIF